MHRIRLPPLQILVRNFSQIKSIMNGEEDTVTGVARAADSQRPHPSCHHSPVLADVNPSPLHWRYCYRLYTPRPSKSSNQQLPPANISYAHTVSWPAATVAMLGTDSVTFSTGESKDQGEKGPRARATWHTRLATSFPD